MDDLTKEQQRILARIYKAYLEKQPALRPSDANQFGSAESIQSNFIPDIPEENVIDACISLKRKGYLNGLLCDNSLSCISLTDASIIYFENKSMNNLKKLTKFLLSLKP